MEELSGRDRALDAAQKCRDALSALNATEIRPLEEGINPAYLGGRPPGGYWHVEQALLLCLQFLLTGKADFVVDRKNPRLQKVHEMLLDGATVVEALQQEGEDFAMEHAVQLGREHGERAAEDWEQHNVGGYASGDVQAVARLTIRGIDDGDPAVLDSLPSSDPSRYETVYVEACEAAGIDPDDNRREVYIRVEEEYVNSFNSSVEDKVHSYCHGHLED